MDSCDVVIVGGGPAGSACAWKLRNSGLDIMMLDKQKFPRDKACSGWITPGVLLELGVDAAEYAKGRVLQPIFGFRTCCMGGPTVETRYDHPVGYGVRRSEFDQYLVERSGVWLQDGEELTSLERTDGGWIINRGLKAAVVVGAGGHFCPVAQHLGARPASEATVIAKEVELRLDEAALERCAVESGMPELYFFPDMKGFGWCMRKGDYINVGLRRTERAHFSGYATLFLNLLRERHKIPADFPSALEGQPYLVYGPATRCMVGDRVLLVGDAAGLAYEHSGEGIRPAIESGLLAAKTLLDARGDYSRARLEPYRAGLVSRLEKARSGRVEKIFRALPARVQGFIARRMLASIRFSRDVLLNRWFLHADEPALGY